MVWKADFYSLILMNSAIALTDEPDLNNFLGECLIPALLELTALFLRKVHSQTRDASSSFFGVESLISLWYNI